MNAYDFQQHPIHPSASSASASTLRGRTAAARLLLVLCALLASMVGVAQAARLPLQAGEELERQSNYTSPDGSHFLIFQNDGNLVVARTADKGFVWGLNAVGGVEFWRAATVRLDSNGRLVALDAQQAVLWQVPAGPARPGSQLSLDDQGELRIVAPDGEVTWSSRKVVVEKPLSSIKNGDRLERDVRYLSDSGQHYLIFAGDGNLVVARTADDGYVWGTNSVLQDFDRTTAVMFQDGELSVLNENINKGKQDGDYYEHVRRWWTPSIDPDQIASARIAITTEGELQVVTGQPVAATQDGTVGEASAPPAVEPQPSPAPSTAAASALTAEQQDILDTHNRLRAAHGVSALTWSPTLADQAQRFANACVQQHGTFESRNGAGENLAAYNHETMSERVQSWYDEEKQYDYNNPGFNKRGASQETQTGHFTQVVWADTRELGCAKADCPGYPWKGFLVCRYLPAGNMAEAGPDGEANSFRRNVPRKQ